MPTTRQPHDPFTDNFRPTLQPHGSQHSLHSNASTTSSRSRQQRDLLAASLSRRPNSRTTPRVGEEVFADSESEPETAAISRQRQLKNAKAGRGKRRENDETVGEFVNRQPDGGFVANIPGFDEALKAQLASPEIQEKEMRQATDDHYAAVAREYFTSGSAVPAGRSSSKRQEDDFEEYKVPMMSRLREQVLEKLEMERWLYEPVDRYQAGSF